jgi:hypothetical protein
MAITKCLIIMRVIRMRTMTIINNKTAGGGSTGRSKQRK